MFRKVLISIFSTLPLLLLACSTDSESEALDHAMPTRTDDTEAAEYQPPSQVRNATIVWSSGPEIDLSSEYGRLVRAAEEAMIVAFYAGMDSTYPGFARSLPRNNTLDTIQDKSQTLTGTLRAHILEIAETPSGFEENVCTQQSKFALRRSDGKYQRRNFRGSETTIIFDSADTPASAPSSSSLPTIIESHASSPSPAPNLDPPQWQAPIEDIFVDSQ